MLNLLIPEKIILRFTLETVENVLFIRTSFMKIQQESKYGWRIFLKKICFYMNICHNFEKLSYYWYYTESVNVNIVKRDIMYIFHIYRKNYASHK
jgi:hypothetical protein